LPKARFETIAASGHCVDMEQPDALARLVTSFIEEN
jgi:pimeloyl-ACP methyl ester carboxylesterase